MVFDVSDDEAKAPPPERPEMTTVRDPQETGQPRQKKACLQRWPRNTTSLQR
jgi:hypothetical protein